jgi:hypothetical protein
MGSAPVGGGSCEAFTAVAADESRKMKSLTQRTQRKHAKVAEKNVVLSRTKTFSLPYPGLRRSSLREPGLEA